jgi:hypothetical protein
MRTGQNSGSAGHSGSESPGQHGTRGPVDPWTRGPVDPWTRGPVDPWTRGPVDPWTRGPVDLLAHATASVDRASIMHWGLDWRRMRIAPGIAGSSRPEQEALSSVTSRPLSSLPG